MASTQIRQADAAARPFEDRAKSLAREGRLEEAKFVGWLGRNAFVSAFLAGYRK